MKVDEVLSMARDAVTVRRVYGEPYAQDGVTVIPAARVAGGAGGGAGHDPSRGEGEGGGFGLQARPVGAYVIKDGAVRWAPAIDVNRLIGALAGVLIAGMLTGMRQAKLHAKADLVRSLRRSPMRGRRRRSRRQKVHAAAA